VSRRSSGRGKQGGTKAAGPGGHCICPKCNHKINHQIGQPCYEKNCPKCGTVMTRV
jgi:hypothetical protein